jgi:hypothetical protein
MATIINASNSTGLTLTSDLSGTLQFQNNGVNLPMSGVAPAFSAYLSSNQSVTGGVYTKITLDTEEFDTNNNFASSRFTPTVAGYYQINGCIAPGTSSITACVAKIYKNGSSYKAGSAVGGTSLTFFGGSVSAVVYLNGSTDYVELYGYVTATTPIFYSGIDTTYFNGCLLRGA